MKIIITESQYKKYKHLFEQSVYDDEERDSNTGYGNEEYDTKEGMVVKGEIKSLPVKFTYSEKKVLENGEIEYYGEIQFYGDEYLGVIATDKRGYLLEFDFYSTLSDEDVRLQNVLKEMGGYYEFEHWLDSEVIPSIQD
jgi:hypothetical protein